EVEIGHAAPSGARRFAGRNRIAGWRDLPTRLKRVGRARDSPPGAGKPRGASENDRFLTIKKSYVFECRGFFLSICQLTGAAERPGCALGGNDAMMGQFSGGSRSHGF